jgi:S1-C subfamily serine protease
MKTTLRVFVLCAAVSMLSMSCLRTFPQAATPEDLMQSTALVYDGQGHGSGVFLTSTTVLTARHVAMDGDAPRSDIIVKDAAGNDHKVTDVRISETADAAILTVSPALMGVHTVISKKPGKVGDVVFCVGAPLDPNWVQYAVGGRIAKVGAPNDQWPHAVLIDAHLAPGCSGGPVFLDGELYGICVGGEGMIVVILPVSAFADLLAQ